MGGYEYGKDLGHKVFPKLEPYFSIKKFEKRTSFKHYQPLSLKHSFPNECRIESFRIGQADQLREIGVV